MLSMPSSDDLVSVYTRDDALHDGTLIDVSKVAGEAGFKVPIALTMSAFRSIEPSSEEKCYGEDLRGRLHDLFWLMRLALRRNSHIEASRIDFQMNLYQDGKHTSLALQALLHPGDRDEPVITILLPNED